MGCCCAMMQIAWALPCCSARALCDVDHTCQHTANPNRSQLKTSHLGHIAWQHCCPPCVSSRLKLASRQLVLSTMSCSAQRAEQLQRLLLRRDHARPGNCGSEQRGSGSAWVRAEVGSGQKGRGDRSRAAHECEQQLGVIGTVGVAQLARQVCTTSVRWPCCSVDSLVRMCAHVKCAHALLSICTPFHTWTRSGRPQFLSGQCAATHCTRATCKQGAVPVSALDGHQMRARLHRSCSAIAPRCFTRSVAAHASVTRRTPAAHGWSDVARGALMVRKSCPNTVQSPVRWAWQTCMRTRCAAAQASGLAMRRGGAWWEMRASCTRAPLPSSSRCAACGTPARRASQLELTPSCVEHVWAAFHMHW